VATSFASSEPREPGSVGRGGPGRMDEEGEVEGEGEGEGGNSWLGGLPRAEDVAGSRHV
jgi:hypothetical protein